MEFVVVVLGDWKDGRVSVRCCDQQHCSQDVQPLPQEGKLNDFTQINR